MVTLPDSRTRRLGLFPVQSGWAIGLTILFAIGLALPGIVIFSNPADYAILHTVLEFTSMAISLMIVALAWSLRRLESNSRIMMIGWISLAVLLIDLAHTLSFPGLPGLGTDNTVQKAITFWLAGRLVAAAGFLLLAVLPARHWSPRLWLPGVLVVTAAAMAISWAGVFQADWVPEFYIPGEGLTPAKRVFEYALSASYALAAILLLLRARRERSSQLAWLATAAWTLTLAELYFTLYVDVTDSFNLMGHLLKVAAYGMVYAAIFASGVQEPYRRLRHETSLLRSLIDATPDLISYTDQRGALLGANRSFSARFGLEPEDVVGRSPVDITWSTRQERARLHLMSDTPERFAEEIKDDSGMVLHFDTLQTPYFNTEGERLGVIEISRDVTAQHAAEERIHHLALFDQLTGLPNRVMLADETDAWFEATAGPDLTAALVFLDLDDFKTINDAIGHQVGDLIIQETARRLSAEAGDGIRVARLGGDEFAVFAPRVRIDGATSLVRSILHAIDAPYRVEHYDLALTASAGVAMYPTDGTTFNELSVRADAAMYRAKQEGRDTFRFFSGDMLVSSAERLELLAALRYAVDRDEIVVHYQPQVSLSDGSVVGVEALARWQHPDGRLLSPEMFIETAEDSGLILQIGEFVLRQAMTDAMTWDSGGAGPVEVSVNLSPVQMVQTDLPERIRRELLRTGFPPERLLLEITESIAMINPEAAAVTIEQFHAMGIQVAIDDFGTGYSSMAYLKRFRIDQLKIDRSFVQDLGRDPEDEAIVIAMIQVAQALRCETVAEGVETHEQAEFLRAHGCTIAQGIHMHRPLPADRVAALLQPVRDTT